MRILRAWRWGVRLVVIATLAALGAYAYLTRPASLRAALEAQLAQSGLRLEAVEHISFSPAGGLRLGDVRVTRAGAAARPPSSADLDALWVRRAHVRCNLADLLLGRFVLRQIVVDEADLSLCHRPSDGMEGLARAVDSTTAGWDWRRLPRIDVRSCDLRLYSQNSDGRTRFLRRWVIAVRGVPHADAADDQLYELDVRQLAGPRGGPQDEPRPLLAMSVGRRGMNLASGWIDLALAAELVPPEWARELRELAVDGHLRVDEAICDSRGVASATVRAHGIRLAVPIEDEGTLAADRWLQVRDGAGVVSVERREDDGPLFAARWNLAASLNGAAAELTGAAELRPPVDPNATTSADAGGASLPAVGGFEIAGRVERLRLPERPLHDGFVYARRLPGPVRAFLDDYRPEGAASISFSFSRQDPSSAPTIEALIDAHGGRCCYRRFPYPIDDVHGRLRFSAGELHLEALHGRHGSALIRADGRVFGTDQWCGFDLLFRGENVPLDAGLYAALPDREQRLWEHVRPIGLADVVTRVHRPHGSREAGPRAPEVEVDARLLAGGLDIRPDARLHHVSGLLRADDGALTIHAIHGEAQGATFALRGAIGLADDPGQARPVAAATRVHIEASDYPLIHEQPIIGPAGESLGSIRLAAVADIWGRLEPDRNGPSAGESTGASAGVADGRYTILIRDGTLGAFDPDWEWQNLNGWVRLGPDAGPELSLSARHELGCVEVAARLPATAAPPADGAPHESAPSSIRARAGDAAPSTDLQLRAAGPAIDRILAQLVPQRWAAACAALNLRGSGELTADLHPAAAGLAPIMEICLSAEGMQPSPLPLELRDISGRLLLREDGFELSEARATHQSDGGELVLSGKGGWRAPTPWSEMQVSAEDIVLTPVTIRALPEPVARLLEQLSLQGRLGLRFDRLRFEGGEARAWRINGQVRLTQADMKLGLELRDFAADVDGACRVLSDGRTELSADFALRGGFLAGRPIDYLEGRLDQPLGEDWLSLSGVAGSMCGGQVIASVQINQKTLDYSLSLTLEDLDLDRFLSRGEAGTPGDAEAQRGQRAPGRLGGRIWVRRQGSQQEPMGGGELRIVGGSLLSTPVSASILDESRRSRLVRMSDALNYADLRFLWQGDRVLFTRVDIRTPDRRLVGNGGAWNLRTDAVELTLVAAPPAGAANLGPLTDLLHGQELVQYRVSGTAAKPRVAIDPLYTLSDALRRMLEGE
ncbi:MAG: hypothetical protein LC135_13965 [Phycisphaerae bacterium]|nr:hypothetical protein [Phycisphaerae bacterium]MCZ2400957.1 hypothetical protein [Phycisphaerae bacterium]